MVGRPRFTVLALTTRSVNSPTRSSTPRKDCINKCAPAAIPREQTQNPLNPRRVGRFCVCSPRSGGQDRRRGGAGRAVELGEPDLRITGDLTIARLTAQLANDFMDLA